MEPTEKIVGLVSGGHRQGPHTKCEVITVT